MKALGGGLAALALFAMMALTFVDVLGRKLWASSVPGSLELTELLLVTVIFSSLPLVALAGEHVVFDSLDAWLPARARRVQQAVIDLLCAAAMGGLAWLMGAKAGQLVEFGETTAQLRMPIGLFVYGMSVLLAVAACAHLLLLARPTPGRNQGGADRVSGAPGGPGGASEGLSSR